MRYVAAFCFAWFALLGVAAARAQEPELALLAERGPRFLVARNHTRVPADVKNMPVLRNHISVDLQDVTLKEALAAISKEAGLPLMYSKEIVQLDARVRLRAQDITVAGALSTVLLDAGVDVLLSSDGRAALVKRTSAPVPKVQEVGVVAGRVTDAQSKDGVAAVMVSVEGTSRGALTDADGHYQVTRVPTGEREVRAQRLGYRTETQRVTVATNATATLDFTLATSPTQLAEIVVTATGEQRRVELGHVVGRINADSLVREAPVSTMSELLTARVPGLQVLQTQGTVGGQVKLQIRGANSIGLRNEPVVVIDGVRYTSEQRRALFGGTADVEQSSPLNDLNPNDVESIEVVKGPSAATLYGTDAANGVIVIMTKHGKPGPARWNAYVRSTTSSVPQSTFPNLYWGWGTVFGTPSNGTTSCTLQRLAARQCTQQDSVGVLTNPLNDPQLSIFRSSPLWEYGASVSGGQQDLRYYFSAEFEDATGSLRMPPATAERLKQQRSVSSLPEEWLTPNALTKVNLRSNISALLGNTAQLRVSTGYIRSAARTAPGLNPYLGQFQAVPATSANLPYGPDFGSYNDPAEAFAQTTEERTDHFLGTASGNWQPAPWLTLRAALGLDLANATRYGLVRPGDQPGNFLTSKGAAEDTRSRQSATTAEIGAVVTSQLGRVSLRSAAGAQYVRNLYTASGTFGTGLPPGGAVAQRASSVTTSQQHVETAVLGGYLEEMLGLNRRLFLTGAIRADGASTFGDNFSAALYPKAGASWLISEEPFMPRLLWLDELRLRYAFGASGRQPLPIFARPNLSGGQALLNGQTVNTVNVFALGNPDLGPERVREHEFGFDTRMLANRLALNATWYSRRTADMLVNDPGPPGRGPMQTNLGLVTQHGFEGEINGRVLETRLLNWDIALTHSRFDTKLVDVGGASMSRSIFGGYVERFPLGARFDRPIVSWQDANGDGILETTEVQLGDTAVYMGNSVPTRSSTLTSVIGLFEGRLRLSALLEHKGGFTQVNPFWCSRNTCRAAVDRNAPLEDQARARRFAYSIEKGDFTRLREVAVALDLPATLTHAVHLRQGTVVFSARNLALWSDFSGADPEVGDPGLVLSNVVGGGRATGIPLGRVFSVRLDVGL